MKFNILIFVFALFSIMGCNTKKVNTPSNETDYPLNRTWMLTYLKGYEKDFLIKNNASLIINDSVVQAYAGCNRMGGSYQITKPNNIKINSMYSTKMFCQETNQLEQDFSVALENAKAFKIEGHFLTIMTTSQDSLKFIAQDWD